MFKVRFSLLLHEPVILYPYGFVILLYNTSNSMSSSPPSITTICWWVWGFFFDGDLVNSGPNKSLGVDGSIHTFIRCDYQTSRDNMLDERTDHCSFMNYFLVITSRECYLVCSITIFFSFLLWTGYGLGESIGVSSFNKENQCCKQTFIIGLG